MFRTMRTSRIAKDTSKYFDASSTTVLPRRSTRASIASDIEDAVKSTVVRKRKRTETVTQSTSAPRRAARRTTKTEIKTEIKSELQSDIEDVPTTETESKPKPRGRTVRKPARKTTNPLTNTTTTEPPTDWEEIYTLVKEMRTTGLAANAAVDTMGCERLARPDASARDRRFHTLVSLMLSSQTKDTVNAEAMARLHTELPPHKEGAEPGLNLENMLAVDEKVLNGLIGKVGFHNNKTKYLKQTAHLLHSHFQSDIPPTIEGLVSLPGVGPKMAHLCMSASNGWNRVEGIGVDVHVHRITNLWGWQSPPSKNPEETRKALESWLPRDKWREINWLLVGFGQTVCLPVGRRCGDCELGLRGLCKSAERKKVFEGRRRREGSVLVTKGVIKGEDGMKQEVVIKEEVDEVEGRVREEVVNAPADAGPPLDELIVQVKEEEVDS